MKEDKEKPKILIVEDVPEMGKTLSDILKAKGYSPLVVITGKEGIAAAKEEDIYLALIDLKLPDIPGIEVMKEIKKNSPRTEVIILTAYASLDTAMEAVDVGAFSYLQKPYDMERLLLDIRRALERIRAEEELKSAEERYRVTFEHTGTAMAILEEDTTISLVNKEFEKLSGYSKEEIEGKKSWTEFVHPDDLERMKNYHEERRKEGGKAPINYEFKAVDREGNIKNLYLNVEMIPGKKKSVISVLDFTERKRTENEVKKSRNFLATIIDNIPDTVTIKDPQHRFVLVNQAYCDITGHSKDEVIGKKTYRERDKEVFQTGKELDLPERSYTDFKGKRHYVSVKKAPLMDESGKVAHVLTISRDITKHKQLDEERERVLKELQELDKMKTDFLNVAYHEMRSPLAPIVASASLLEQENLTAKQKRLVFIIEQSVKQLEKLINRLLELTRVDAGKVELKLQRVSIPEIVKNVLEYLEPLADAKKHTITVDVPEGIEIEGDEQKITDIFDNLVSNAIKYTETNGKIDIKVADKGEDIVVSIADTGTGISEEQLSRVFERFFMADTSLSRKGGLGLGLSIVKEYVKLHGGKVWATSELGKGSNFFFTVPKKQRKINSSSHY